MSSIIAPEVEGSTIGFQRIRPDYCLDRPVTQAALAVILTLLTALSILQLAVAAGAPLGRFVWGGQHATLPPGLRFGSAASPLIYAFIAVVLLERAGTMNALPSGFTNPAAWAVTGYFTLGIAMNGISRSR